MSRRCVACLLIATGLCLPGPNVAAQTAADSVIACDTLVNLRVLMAEGDRAAAASRLPQHPGCRTMARDRVGAPERRAMIGGAPFECAAIQGAPACAWIFP